MTTRQLLRHLRARVEALEGAVEAAYERGLAEGRRREQQVHRETWYADHWTAPKKAESAAHR